MTEFPFDWSCGGGRMHDGLVHINTTWNGNKSPSKHHMRPTLASFSRDLPLKI